MTIHQILEKFRQENSELCKLTPLVWVDKITETYHCEYGERIFDPPKIIINLATMKIGKKFIYGRDEYADINNTEIFNYEFEFDQKESEIRINHPMIFDLRLIPKECNKIKVQNMIWGNYPKEFPDLNVSLPMEEVFAPENYENFVKNNIDLLRQTFYNNNLTINDALDSLTGGFEAYKNECNEATKWRMEDQKNEVSFFDDLLQKTKIAYKKSNIIKTTNTKNRGYSLLATSIMKNKPLIIGFNWSKNSYSLKKIDKTGAQVEYPFRDFSMTFNQMGSLKGAFTYFEEYYPKALLGMQSNYCFFKSEKESQITDYDLKISEQLFEDFLLYISPSIIITFSSRLKNYLIKSGKLQKIESTEINADRITFFPIKAKFIFGNKRKVDFVYLPHPNNTLKKAEREKAWEFCFQDKN